MTSAPAAMASIDARRVWSYDPSSPVSRMTLRWARPDASFEAAMSSKAVAKSPDRKADRLRTMSISSAPAATARRISSSRVSCGPEAGREGAGHAGHEDAGALHGLGGDRDHGRVDADGGDGRHRCGRSGRDARPSAQSAFTLPGVSAPSRVVRSQQRMARSRAAAFDSRLIERPPRALARASRPTASTGVTRTLTPPTGGIDEALGRRQTRWKPRLDRTSAPWAMIRGMSTTVVDHPLAAERLTALRDERTPRPEFRRALSELSWLLVYEATRDLQVKTFQVQTPLAPATGTRIDPVPLIVPVLRAGLGMLDAAFEMLPSAEVGFVGLRRNEESLDSEEYMTTVPDDLDGRPAIILDPMLATGGSLVHTVEIVERSNPGRIIVVCVLAAPEGIAHFGERYPDADVFTAVRRRAPQRRRLHRPRPRRRRRPPVRGAVASQPGRPNLGEGPMHVRRTTGLFVFATLVAVAVAASPASPATAAHAPEAALSGVRSVEPGFSHSCALLTNGQVRCWGSDSIGQLGNGPGGSSPTPVPVLNTAGTGPLTGVVQVTSGTDFSCARLSSGQAVCWGVGDVGQLGNNGTTSQLPVPLRAVSGVGPLTGITQLSVGGAHGCALLASRQLRCWGVNGSGQLGDGSNDLAPQPVVVSRPGGGGPLTQVTQISTSPLSTCARLSTGQARCWGGNDDGQVGDGGNTERTRPRIVRSPNGTGALTGVVQVATTTSSACALLTSGQVRCWGGNVSGQLGDGTLTPSPFPSPVQNPGGDASLTGVAQLDGGNGTFLCARMTSRQLRCWGQGSNGQIGDGGGVTRRLPSTVRNVADTAALSNVSSVAVGTSFACARLLNAQVRCWGANGSFQLGDTTNMNRPLPVVVALP